MSDQDIFNTDPHDLVNEIVARREANDVPRAAGSGVAHLIHGGPSTCSPNAGPGTTPLLTDPNGGRGTQPMQNVGGIGEFTEEDMAKARARDEMVQLSLRRFKAGGGGTPAAEAKPRPTEVETSLRRFLSGG